MAIGVIANDEKNKFGEIEEGNKYFDSVFQINVDDENESRANLVRRINKNSVVLDVGCSQGLIGAFLKDNLNCNVYGIEVDEKAVEICKKTLKYKNIYNFDITETSDEKYKKFFSSKIKYDYVLFSDVLEHLIDPGKVLLEFSKLLNRNGKILVSIPNIAHYDVIDGLLNENFNYSKMGILDDTHLRFFTKSSFVQYIDNINKFSDNEYIFDVKSIGKTVIKPKFYEEYNELSKIIDNNEELLVLQHQFEISLIDKNSNPINLNKILKEEKVNYTFEINKKLEDLKNENDSLKKQNDFIKQKNQYLLYENNNLKSYSELITKNYEGILNSKYWKLGKPVRVFEKMLKKIKFDLSFVGYNNKPNVLFFVHSWIDPNNIEKKNIGGTTLNVIEVINQLNPKINAFVITIINGKYVLVYFNRGKQIIFDLGINVCVYRFDGYHFDFLYKVLKIINNLNIDLVHINHIINFPCDLQIIAKKVKTMITLHDYTTICPTYFLIDVNKKYCKDATSNKCLECSKNIEINTRNNAIQNLFKNCYKIIAPDESVIKEISSYYDLKNTDVIPNGINLNEFADFKISKHIDKEVKNIGIVGIVNQHKGSEIIKKIIENDDDGLKYHLFGDSEDSFYKEEKGNFINHGLYDKKDLPKLLNDYDIDVVLLLSICPESFSYVLSETLLAKVPVVCFDIGAIGNRVKKYKAGIVLDVNSNYLDVINAIKSLVQNGNYQRYIKNIDNVDIPTIDEMTPLIWKNYELCNKKYNNMRYFKNELKKYPVIYKI